MCRRSLSSPSAFTVRETALAALGAAAVTRIGAPTKPLDLDAERATRFCEWIGEVEDGKGGQGYVASGDRGGPAQGSARHLRKPYDLKLRWRFPVDGRTPRRKPRGTCGGRACDAHLRDGGANGRREGRHSVANYLRTFACGRARCREHAAGRPTPVYFFAFIHR